MLILRFFRSDVDVGERLARRYTLNIRDDSSNKTYNLNFPGTRTVLEVKNDIYSLTDIPIRHQVWAGWPHGLDDNTCLALAGLSYPSHDLTVKRSVIQSTKNSKAKDNRDKHKKILVDLVDSDTSSVEEFEDASESFNIEDDIFIDNVETKKVEPLSMYFLHLLLSCQPLDNRRYRDYLLKTVNFKKSDN